MVDFTTRATICAGCGRADAAAFATATFGFAKVPVTQVTSRPGKGKSRAGDLDRKGPSLIK